MTDKATQPPQQLVTFKTGEYAFGIDVLEVQEVLKHQQMTAVPLAPEEVRGLINLRGHIVTAIGMRERLHLKAVLQGTDQMNLIVSLKDGSASLVVDSVGDVIGALQRVQRQLHAAQQHLAGHRQLHPAPDAAEQRLAQLRLQLLHLMTDGRLRQAQLVGSAGKAAQPGGGLEAGQQAQRRNA